MLYTSDVMRVARVLFLVALAAAAPPSGDIACPGVCVELCIAQYCEAYLDSPELCVKGKVCCVSEDSTSDVKTSERKWSIKRSANMSPPTPSTTQQPVPQCSGNCVSRVFALFCDNVHEDMACPGEDVCCVPEDKPSSTTRKPTTTTTLRPGPECRGECISGLFSLLCDNVDVDATCPGDGVCCFKEDKPSTISTTAVE